MKIIRLIAENLKRISAVEIRPDGSTVKLVGKNEQGKSSILDAIEIALRGPKASPAVPVTKGKKKATIDLDLGDIIVKRTVTAKGGWSLKVTDAEGEPQSSPQTLLDKLVGRISFDPLAFSREKPPEQAKVVRDLSGLDFTDLDEQRTQAYEDRTETNKKIRNLETKINGLPMVEAPPEEVSVADLLAEETAARAATEAKKEAAETVDNFEKEMVGVNADLAAAQQKVDLLLDRQKEVARDTKLSIEARDILPDAPDIEEIRDRMSKVEETNTLVRQAKERAELSEQLREAKDVARRQTSEIEMVDDEKLSRVANATLPVPGLGFDEEGLTLDDIPFKQCSQAVKIRTSVAMGIAMNPDLKVLLIREGSLLDADNMKAIGEMAEAADAQVWIECVGEEADGGLLIEDGRVVEKAGS